MQRFALPLACVLTLLTTSVARAVPITNARTVTGVDYVSAGVGGVSGGTGAITIAGVTGTVTSAFLYWHGIDLTANGGNGVYDNASIVFNGTPIVGTSLGDSSTNCFGPGSSRGFRASVTSLVPGDGVYTLSGLSNGTGHSANGASLVVLFNDGNAANNRDLVFFEGNDSDHAEGFPGETDGWFASLAGINYAGGAVNAQMHVADGQFANTAATFADGSITFSADAPVTVPDTLALWDGLSVPNLGTSRAANGSLWDIHTFSITPAFTSNGAKTLTVNGMTQAAGTDCHSLVMMLVDLGPGAAPDPGSSQAASIPALSPIALLALCGALAGVAAMMMRR